MLKINELVEDAGLKNPKLITFLTQQSLQKDNGLEPCCLEIDEYLLNAAEYIELNEDKKWTFREFCKEADKDE